MQDDTTVDVAMESHEDSIAVGQAAGSALRLTAQHQHLRDERERIGPLQQQAMRYDQALMIQIGQTAICNCYVSVDQQPRRWLLMRLDRLPGSNVRTTRELIALSPLLRQRAARGSWHVRSRVKPSDHGPPLWLHKALHRRAR